MYCTVKYSVAGKKYQHTAKCLSYKDTSKSRHHSDIVTRTPRDQNIATAKSKVIGMREFNFKNLTASSMELFTVLWCDQERTGKS